MNISIPHPWLKEYVKTSKSPKEIARRVAVSGPSIERVETISGQEVYDVEITTNRVDSFSITGFAREVGVILGEAFSDPLDGATLKKEMVRINKAIKENIKKGRGDIPELKVTIKDEKLCRRYTGALLENVKIGPSPKWLKERLEICGVRSINNVVDITNYVMLELGLPMHAFDAEKVSGGKLKPEIIVRHAKKGEVITALDGTEKKLTDEMLVIADSENVLAIAGVKGGEAAEISDNTTTIVLEAASFDPVNIRTTSRILNLRTDASARFEKNLHPDYTSFALVRAISLLEQHANARVIALADEYPKVVPASTYDFSWSTLSRMSGIKVDTKESMRILKSLGFGIQKIEEGLNVTVPFWREYDIEGEADFVEEIIRIYGYEKLPVEPLRGALPLYNNDKSFFWERETKHFLRDIGWTEIVSYSFIGEELLKKARLDTDETLKIFNPLTVDFEYMRPSLIIGLLQVASDHAQKCDEMNIFELSKVYYPKKNALPDEELRLSGLLTKKGSVGDAFINLKGAVEALMQLWLGKGAEEISYDLIKNDTGFFAGGFSARLMHKHTELGMIGVLRDGLGFDLSDKTVAIFDVNFQTALSVMTTDKSYTALSKYPAVLRDLAFVVDKESAYRDLVAAMENVSPLIRHIELFDIFANDKLGKNKHSLAFHIEYRSDDKTLSAEEVDKVHERLVGRLVSDYGVEVR